MRLDSEFLDGVQMACMSMWDAVPWRRRTANMTPSWLLWFRHWIFVYNWRCSHNVAKSLEACLGQHWWLFHSIAARILLVRVASILLDFTAGACTMKAQYSLNPTTIPVTPSSLQFAYVSFKSANILHYLPGHFSNKKRKNDFRSGRAKNSTRSRFSMGCKLKMERYISW